MVLFVPGRMTACGSSQRGRRGDVTHRDTLFSRQWAKIVKIGDVGQTDNGNIDATATLAVRG